MATWFYQINSQSWPQERYRIEIWEGERWSWPVGQKLTQGHVPAVGDVITFFYAKGGNVDPGFFGWAVILEWLRENSTLYFRAVSPSDQLKMDPWWDEEAEDLANRIRGKMKQRTLWFVELEDARRLRAGIKKWVSAPGPLR